MARQDVDLTNFTAGELSPRLKGRTDLAKYFNGCDTALNMVIMPQGGATKRPGTFYVADAGEADTTKKVKLRRFIFSTVQAYMLEFRAGKVRIYMNDAPVLNAGVPVDVTTPYSSADLAALKFTQSADTLYIFHPNYPPATLTRSSHIAWTYAAIVFRDGPYLNINTTATTLTPSGTGGAITVTASSIVGINGGVGFINPTDVGRLIRIKDSAVWGWVKIDGVVSPTVVNATVQAAVIGGASGAAGALDGVAATANWRLGAWSATTGYPYAPSFWQQRLFGAGYNAAPNAVIGSVTGDFTNMAPSQSDGTVTSAHALNWQIDDDQVNAVRWLSPAGSAQAQQLGIGTSGGEQILQAATTATALTPTSVQAYRETAYGSAPNVDPVRVGKALLFMDATGRKLREWSFYWQVNGYSGPDLTRFSEHVTRGANGDEPTQNGLTDLVYQQAPHQIVWGRRNDGVLIGLTYDREQDVFAPHRHRLGGNWYGGPPYVESIDCIPSPDGTYDELWLSVLRTINGTPKRFIEVMTRFFDGAAQDFAFFVDAGLNSALTYPAATLTFSGLANTATEPNDPAFTGTGTFIASVPATFNSGNVNAIIRVNGGRAQVTAFIDGQHVTAQVLTPLKNLAASPSGEWSCDNQHTSFSGLAHLNGETVSILADGAVAMPVVVSGGVAAVSDKASYGAIGLLYRPELVGMPWEPIRAAAAASQGKVKRIDSIYVRFHETLGCNFGTRARDSSTKAVREKLEPMQSRSAADFMGQAPGLFSGIERLKPQGGYDQEGQIVITQSEPLPLTVLAIFAKGETAEMPQP